MQAAKARMVEVCDNITTLKKRKWLSLDQGFCESEVKRLNFLWKYYSTEEKETALWRYEDFVRIDNVIKPEVNVEHREKQFHLIFARAVHFVTEKKKGELKYGSTQWVLFWVNEHFWG